MLLKELKSVVLSLTQDKMKMLREITLAVNNTEVVTGSLCGDDLI
jgi:hypothetical protein